MDTPSAYAKYVVPLAAAFVLWIFAPAWALLALVGFVMWFLLTHIFLRRKNNSRIREVCSSPLPVLNRIVKRFFTGNMIVIAGSAKMDGFQFLALFVPDVDPARNVGARNG